MPLALGSVNKEAVEEFKLAPNEVLKFAIEGVDADAGQVMGARFIGKAPAGKKADAWSKILFQGQLRAGGISIGDLCAGAARSTGVSTGVSQGS